MNTMVIGHPAWLIMEPSFVTSVIVHVYSSCFLYRAASRKTRDLSQKFDVEIGTRAAVG